MIYAKVLASLLASGFLVSANEVAGMRDGDASTTLNQHLLSSRKVEKGKPNEREVVVFVGDRVIPQFVDGAGWKTSISLVNLESRPVTFQVLFFQSDGRDLIVPVEGQGPVRGMNVSLAAAGSVTFETAGTSGTLSQGWALISQSLNDTVGGFAIFRQRASGRPDFEAVVPIVSQFDNHFVLLFDNTAFTTATAIANPTPQSVVIPLSIRNEAGQVIDTRTIALGPYGHTAFTLPDRWASTIGRRGAIEFLTSGFGVGALGLRFGAASFTSFHVLSNFNWRR
jgi:hypothetical protein